MSGRSRTGWALGAALLVAATALLAWAWRAEQGCARLRAQAYSETRSDMVLQRHWHRGCTALEVDGPGGW